LRVARGLFRLWLVLSVLWIGGVAVETWWISRSMIGYLRRLRAGTIPNLGGAIPLEEKYGRGIAKPAFDPDQWLRDETDKERRSANESRAVAAGRRRGPHRPSKSFCRGRSLLAKVKQQGRALTEFLKSGGWPFVPNHGRKGGSLRNGAGEISHRPGFRERGLKGWMAPGGRHRGHSAPLGLLGGWRLSGRTPQGHMG
jgi:hypothetical protein